ncbi:MAG: DNA primase [Syntrophaceae bacterium]
MEGKTRSDLDEIRNRANIVEVVSEYVTLRKAGRNFVGLCPFHREKTPSFSVNPDKQIFYCFGCGEGGDVFSFLMKINNTGFPEALKLLAGKLGIALAQYQRPAEADSSPKKQIFKINAAACEYFSRCLAANMGAGAREYLKKRGIGEQIIKDFRLGFAPDGWRNLRSELEKNKVPLKLAELAGLLVAKEGRADYYDRFRARLIFPVEDLNGQIIAFGGRILGKGDPKYLNSPESPVYIKGRNLYALSRSREEIRKQGFAIIVEGYFDALAMWAAGIRNIVATLGTALTKDHLDLLRRYTDELVIIFDPDDAGRHAVERSLKLFLAEKISARIVLLPDNLDPDEYVRKFGKEAMLDQISGSQSLIDFFIDKNVAPGQAPEKRISSLRESLAFLSQIEDVLQRNIFLKRMSERLGIDQELLKAELNKANPAGRQTDSKNGTAKGKKEFDPIELGLIRMMLNNTESIRAAAEQEVFSFFLDEELKRFGELLAREADNAEISVLIGKVDNRELQNILWKLMVSESPFENSSFERIFADTVKKIKIKWFRQRHEILKIELRKAEERKDQKTCNSILLEKEKLKKEEKAL